MVSALQAYSGDRTGSTSTDREGCDAQSHQTPNRNNFLTADNDEKCHIAILNVALPYWVAHTCGSGGTLGMTGGKDLDWEKQRCAAPLKGGL